MPRIKNMNEEKAIAGLDEIQRKIVDLVAEERITKEEYDEIAKNIHQAIRMLEWSIKTGE